MTKVINKAAERINSRLTKKAATCKACRVLHAGTRNPDRAERRGKLVHKNLWLQRLWKGLE